MAGKKDNYASLKILIGILLFVCVFGGIIATFLNLSGNRSLYERFTSPNVSIEYYYMDGCGHCKDFSPIWDDFASKLPSDAKYTVKKYNINDGGEGEKRGSDLGVNSAPTIFAIDTTKSLSKDAIVDTLSGDRSKEKLLEFANKNGK